MPMMMTINSHHGHTLTRSKNMEGGSWRNCKALIQIFKSKVYPAVISAHCTMSVPHYLQILFPVECDGLCLHFAFFEVHFVPTQHDRNAFTNPDSISVPLLYIVVCLSGHNVKHDNSALAVNVEAIAQAKIPLPAKSVPHIELDRTTAGVEYHRMNFQTHCCWPLGKNNKKLHYLLAQVFLCNAIRQ